MKKSIATSIIATVLALSTVIFAVSVFANPKEGIKGNYLPEAMEVLERSIDKTVKKNINYTVTQEELFYYFGFDGITCQGIQPNAERMGSSKSCFLQNIMFIEHNGFLKENDNGELYTVFKTDKGIYYYIIMSVNGTGDEQIIKYDRSYFVTDGLLTNSDFEDVEIGKTTRKDIYDLTGQTTVESIRKYPVHNPVDVILSNVMEQYGYKTLKEAKNNKNVMDIAQYSSYARVTDMTYLTAEGLVKVSFGYNEEVDDIVVTAIEYIENNHINPEDLEL